MQICRPCYCCCRCNGCIFNITVFIQQGVCYLEISVVFIPGWGKPHWGQLDLLTGLSEAGVESGDSCHSSKAVVTFFLQKYQTRCSGGKAGVSDAAATQLYIYSNS